jgi:GTP-binding protein HflX
VLPGGRAVTVSDTVGFVRRLPHDLVEAFKSTLEEVARADLILHVADASVHDLPDQIAAVREVLGEIGAAELPEVVLLNKWDLVDEMERARLERRHPDAVPVSALTGDGAERVLAAMAEALPRLNDVTLLVPHDRSDVVPWLYREEQVVSTDAGAEGTLVRARVSERGLARVEPFRVPPPSAARAQS